MASGLLSKFRSALPFRKSGQRAAGSDEANTVRMDPAEVKKHFDRIGYFRILVLGRSNAGKTTLLQRVCNTTELPEIFNAKGEKIDLAIVQGSLERGYHNIEDELIFRSNPGFIFHDSRGFETGSVKELNLMKDFVTDRARTLKLERRIHAIWFCISMADYERPILAAEEKFFDECNTGNVPVIAVLTKADTLRVPALNQLMRESGLPMKEVKPRVGEFEAKMLSTLRAKIESQLSGRKYPPKAYLSVARMNQEDADCSSLLRCTIEALNEVELQKLVVSTQQANIVLNIEYSVKRGLKYFVVNNKFDKIGLEMCIMSWMPFKYYRREALGAEGARLYAYGGALYLYALYLGARLEGRGGGRRALYENQDNNLFKDSDVDITSGALPLMHPLFMVSPMHKSIIHGAGCILIFEYSYFLLQQNGDASNTLDLAVKEYQTSGTQATVLNALQHAIKEHSNNNYDALMQVTVDIIVNNCMSKKLL